MAKLIRRPRDFSQRALSIVQQATGQIPKLPTPFKNPAAVALGRLGGAKGGKARAASLNSARRKSIARKAARSRWHNPS